ncbi:uncharacterized protein LOC130049116 [Ostrea edulis]|uniref:uncharacterized protein LOC130049116 n=1 Tax=Ostrea edulis TaxID=37623 RepID=UPI0024AEF0B7|nr:uncharacterized protein LOC130049116 [Ostrea edulis]
MYFLNLGSYGFVEETQMDSEETQYADDPGILESVCPDTCPTEDSQEVNEPPLKRARVKPLQASLSRRQMTSSDAQENIIKRLREKSMPGVHQILLSRIEGPVTPCRYTNASFVEQIQNGQTAACTSSQPLAVHLIGEHVNNVDIQHLNGYSYKCLGGIT